MKTSGHVICFVIPSLQAGGMERVMSELLWQFHQTYSGELHLVLYGRKRDVFFDIPDKVIIHRPNFAFNNYFRFWHTIKTLVFLRQRLIKLQPTAILSFGERWNNMVLLATLGKKLPIFVSDRCQPDKSLGKLQNSLRKWLYPKAKGVIAQTAIAKHFYQQQFNHSNIRVIGNPIRLIPNDPKIKKEKIVLSVGRLIDTKHHDRLIKVFAELNRPDWRLVIIGGDALKQKNTLKLSQLIDQLGLQNKVSLTGPLQNIQDYYLKSEIFAFMSSSEGFPNVIGEAQSAGLPVVSFDCVAGPSDMITDGDNGFLVPLFDYETFSKRLDQLMDDEGLREKIGKKAQQSVREFSTEKISNQFYEAITAPGSFN